MLFSAAISALSLAAFAAAQNQTVTVGASTGNFFVYNPASINATNGSVITFEFQGSPGNHSVTQSTFADPCDPETGGFDSGWVNIPSGVTTGFPTWNLTITNDQKPIWFYCKQLAPSPHCIAGMVGAINAPGSGANTFTAYQAAAKSHSGNPGQGVGNLVGIGASASSGPGPFASGETAVGVPTGSSNSSASSSGSSSATGTSSAASTSTSKSSASSITVSAFTAFVAALFGIALS